MKAFFVFFIIVVIISYSAKAKDTDLINLKKCSDTSLLGSLTILKESNRVKVNLVIKSFSIDSIIAELTFINDSTEEFFLYKPILPFAPLSENHFVFTDSSLSLLVSFTGLIDSSRKYYEGSSLFYGMIKPELNSKNIIRLQPAQHITITTNVAAYYNFKKYYLKGIHDFKCKYLIFMPCIKSGEHIFENQEYSNEKSPVYLVLTSGNSLKNSDDTFEHFIIP